MGLEPMTSGAARRRADQVALCPSFNGLVLPLQCETGRDGRVRTDGLMHPMHARYQAALRPECAADSEMFFGVTDGTRTHDPRNHNPML